MSRIVIQLVITQTSQAVALINSFHLVIRPFLRQGETGLPVSVTCNIHPWMKAYAVFREDGYVAVSSGDGTFEIPDLPAGEPLEFQVWHERATGRGGRWILISQNCNGIQRDGLK